MRNNVLTVMKKECARIIGDKKLFFTTVLLPGLMLFIMYFFMGTFMAAMFTVDDDYMYQIHTVNLPDSIAEIMQPEELRLEILPTQPHEIEEVKARIENRETDVLLIFPENFDELVANFHRDADIPAPNIQVWSNMTRTESGEAGGIVMQLLNAYHFELTHIFRINAPEYAPDGRYDLATDADLFAMIIGMMIPMLFIIFIYNGCMSIAPESIAGEKERGTLGSILVTPARRRDIALGKILGIAVFALMGAAVSIFAVLLSMPALLAGMEMEASVWEMYSLLDFALLFFVAISTTLVAVSLLSVLSAYAKSVKEAMSYAAPTMILVVLAGTSGLIFGGVPEGAGVFFIPIVNSSLSITAIFSADAINVPNVLITIATNFALTVTLTLILAKIFSSERIIFDK
ncbi:MAG: ABC transporter permease subunit [Defluviitaleaceae bacterium]|nr:ABC transporter permease subunit [Defluviitaleaceae bacterium]